MPDLPRSARCSPCDLDWPLLYRAKPCPLCGGELWPNDFDPLPITEARELERAHDAAVRKQQADDVILKRYLADMDHIEDELSRFAKVDSAPDK